MHKQKGFSLIEVLVTLVLTTIGVLGMVVLQSKAVTYTSDASARDTAVTLTNELIEIMRSHRDDLFKYKPPAEYAYMQILRTTDVYNSSGALTVSASDCPNNGLPQTLKQRAGCWVQKMEQSLPAPEPGANGQATGRVVICPSFKLENNGSPSCAGSTYVGSGLAVQITWRGKDQVCGANNDQWNCSYTARVEL